MLRARMRAAAGWSDASILNISSRGMMINATPAALNSKEVELWHGGHVIVATVVWRQGSRAGLRAEDAIPVDEIMALSRSPGLQLTAAEQWPRVERRKRPRSNDQNSVRGRLVEFAGVTFIGLSLAAGAFALIEQAFAKPLGLVRASLGG